RHLVKDRMDMTGAHWSIEEAEAVLKLRALRCNSAVDTYWNFHLAQERWRTDTADAEVRCHHHGYSARRRIFTEMLIKGWIVPTCAVTVRTGVRVCRTAGDATPTGWL